MNKLSCMILDDEPGAANLLELLVAQCTNWEIVAKCHKPEQAAAILQQHAVDFIFLDIRMPGMDGLEFTTLLPKHTSVVFSTAYKSYAVESYNVSALDYLLKPVTMNRFLVSKIRIESHFQARMAPTAAGEQHYFVRAGHNLHRVELDEILYIAADKEYVTIVMPRGEMKLYRRLKDIASQLSSPFVRVHQSFIVNTKNLTKVQDNHVYIGHMQIPIGARFREGFFDEINRRLF